MITHFFKHTTKQITIKIHPKKRRHSEFLKKHINIVQ